jgi:hypothetical protein
MVVSSFPNEFLYGLSLLSGIDFYPSKCMKMTYTV